LAKQQCLVDDLNVKGHKLAESLKSVVPGETGNIIQEVNSNVEHWQTAAEV